MALPISYEIPTNNLTRLLYIYIFSYANATVYQLTSCVRVQDDRYTVHGTRSGVHWARTRCLENRDSMALLAAIFTGALNEITLRRFDN